MEEERSSSLTVTVVVLCIAAVAAMYSLPSFSPKERQGGNTGGSVGASSITTGEAWQLKRDVSTLRRDVDKLKRQLKILRKDHEALSSWTLQSLLASQSREDGAAPLAPPPQFEESVTPVPTPVATPLVTPPPDRFRRRGTWGDRELSVMLDSLQLFPQQVDQVKPLLRTSLDETREVIRRLRSEGALSPAALAEERDRIQQSLRQQLSSILTEEQMSRFDDLNKRRDRYTEDGPNVTQTGTGRAAPPPPSPTTANDNSQ